MRRAFWSFAPLPILAVALAVMLGAQALVLAALLSLPWLAWRHDNARGTFLVLAILFLIVLAVAALLLALMSVTHR